MHLNDLCAGTGNQFNLIQQPTYSDTPQSINHQSTNLPANQPHLAYSSGGHPNGHHPNQLADDSSQLNSSLSSSSGVGCTSSSSSGLGTTSSLFSSNSSGGLSNNPTHSTMNGSNNTTGGSLANHHHVLLPLSDLNGGGGHALNSGHGLQRAQLISNLNGSSNQYTTLTFPNGHYYSSTSSPSSVNTAGTGSTLPSTVPINGPPLSNQSTATNKIYALQNGQLLNDSGVYCQTTSFNSAIMDNSQLPVTGHYQLLTKQSNYQLANGLAPSNYATLATHSPANSYLLQTVPAGYAGQPPSIAYHDDLNASLNKFNANAQFDLICDNRMSPVYSKLSPNSNSLIKECLITNAENARNSAKFIELTSSQNSTASVYSDTLKSRLASPKDSLKLIQAASTGLDLLNCDKTYNEIIKSSDQLKARTESLGKLADAKLDGKCKEACKNRKKCQQQDKCGCRGVAEKAGKEQANCQQQCQLAAKVVKSNSWCCSTSGDNPRKQGICFILLATVILVLLLCFLTLTTSPKFSSLLGEL